MGFFNKIKSSDSLSNAIKKKANQKSISSRTVSLIEEKINNYQPNRFQQHNKNSHLLNIESGFDSVLQSKNGPARDQIIRLLQAGAIKHGMIGVLDDFSKKIQPGSVTNVLDEIIMSLMVDALKKKYPKIKYFNSIPELISGVKLHKNGHCVVKMGGVNDKSTGHFAAVEFRTIDNNKFIIVFESAHMANDQQAGVDYGLELLKKNASQIEAKIAFIELSAQKSPDDCAIFALNTATKLKNISTFNDGLITSMQRGKRNLTYYYELSSQNHIKNTEQKIGISVPSSIMKHAHSLRSLGLRHVDIVNKKNETLQQRAERHKIITNDGRTYSNSIEYKRIAYYQLALNYIGSS